MGGHESSPTILMVLESAFPVSGGGGAESQVMSLGRCLAARGFRVEVVVPRVPNGRQLARETCEGLDVTRLVYPHWRFVGGVVMLAKLAVLLVARRRDYSVIHCHIANNMAAVACVVGRLLGKRVIVKLTGMKEMQGGILDTRPGFATRAKKRAIATASGLQATSSRIAALLVARGFDRSRVLLVPNGVSLDRFRAGRDAELRGRLCGPARFVGLFVGRLSPEKGHELLFRAWSVAFAGRDDVCLLLVGDGAMRQPLQALAEQLGIGGQVRFAGHADDVAPFIAVADLGILTSLAEGLSNALLEYMAGGLGVIGSRVSGTEDFVVQGETGWLFEPGDCAGLVSCLQDAAAVGADALRALGSEAQRRMAASASLDAVADQLIVHYRLGGAEVSSLQAAK